MNTELIVHPTKAWAKPRTVKATAPKVSRETNQQLRDRLAARGIKSTTKHTKLELLVMLASGSYQKPAAYARDAAQRKAKAAK